MRRPLLLLYFASGVGALVVETIWMRWLRGLLGATAPAASATLVAFFAGHALGAAWAARACAARAQGQGERSSSGSRPHLHLYGRLELAAALAACAVPLGLALGEHALALVYDRVRDLPGTLALVRFAVALVASLPAAFCFGATFPVIAAAAVGSPSQLGARGGALYAVNTLGAALGTALATFWLPGLVGVTATYGFAIACLAVAGGGAVLLSRGVTEIAEPADAPIAAEPAPALRATPKSRAQIKREKKQAQRRAAAPVAAARIALRPVARELGRRGLLALAVASGFGAFALQVLLVQSFAQVLNQSIYAFGAVLVVVLLAIAAAGALVAALQSRAGLDPRTLLGLALVAAALALAAFPASLARATHDFEYVGGDGGGLAYLAAALGVVVATAGPAILAASFVFPATFAAAGRSARDGAGSVLGRLVVANTLGAIAGAIAAPYLLMPAFGLWPSFAALSIGYGAAAVFVPEANLRWRLRRDLIARRRLDDRGVPRESARGAALPSRAGRDRARDRDDTRGGRRRRRARPRAADPHRQPLRARRHRGARSSGATGALAAAARAARDAASRTWDRRRASAPAARSPTRSSRCTWSRSCRASRARPSCFSPTPTAASTATRAPTSCSTTPATSCARRASASTS